LQSIETLLAYDAVIAELLWPLAILTGQRDVTVADAAETARRTFLEVESAVTQRPTSSPHHCTSSAAAAAVTASTTTPLIGRDVQLCDEAAVQQLPSR